MQSELSNARQGHLFKTPFIELTIPNDLVITHNIPLFNPVITQGMPRFDASDKIIGTIQ
jgi:hypothetical protein